MDSTQKALLVSILTKAVKQQASDLHFTVGNHPAMRVDGRLVLMDDEDVYSQTSIESVAEVIFSDDERAQLDKERTVVTTYEFEGKVRVKASAYFQEGKLSLSLHFLSVRPKLLRELNIPEEIEKLTELSRGLVIFGGFFGSGRTTLAVALLEQINRTRAKRIITIEHPIEYSLVSDMAVVEQREVGTDIPTFEAGLEAALREDVDVVFVGEMSTPSAIKQVLELASNGVLVFATMDGVSSSFIVEKILTSFEGDEQSRMKNLMIDALEAVIIQRLVPRIGGGVLAVHEVLFNTPSVKSLILTNRASQIPTVIRTSRDQGMKNLDLQLAMLVRNQEVTMENALAAAIDQDSFKALAHV